MIPILYEKDETAFTSNGICRLPECISCTVTEERNGIYECTFEYPIAGGHFDELECGRIIAVTHDDTGDIQPFDIISYTRPINGVVTFHAVHISYRQTEMTVRGTSINSLASALTLMKSASPSNPFTYKTNITSTAYFGAGDGIPRTVRNMLGGVEGSILDTYGGEYEWDKWTVYLWKERGTVKDFVIRYGVNMTKYNEDCDYTAAYSSVIPYWSKDNGTEGKVTVVASRVDSGLKMYNDRNVCVPMDLSDKFENQPTTTQLRDMALSRMNADLVNLPKQNISVDFIRISESEEYSIYTELMQCRLCDMIPVYFPWYGMQATFKIVKTVYDVLKGRFTSMELGDLSTGLTQALGIKKK